MQLNLKRASLLAFTVVCLALLAVAPAAKAEPRTVNMLQVGAGFRYGIELEDGDFNPWGPGLGLDVGYTTQQQLYIGGVFDYFFGDSESGPGGSVDANIWHLGAEGGYDLGDETVVIRPKLGLGVATIVGELCLTGFGCQDDSETDFALTPGAQLMLFPGSVMLSLDLRYQFIFADPDTVNALIFSIGIGF